MNLFSRLVSLLLFLSAITGIRAQQADSAAQNTWLWEVSGKGLKQPSYLYGTIHLICPEDVFISDGLLRALNKSKRLVLETTNSDSTPDLLGALEGATLKDKRLKDFYTAEEYGELKQFFKDTLKIDIDKLGGWKPGNLDEFFMPKMLDCKTVSYESILTKLARKQNKEVSGFLTMKEHYRLLDYMSDSAQAMELLETVRGWEKYKQSLLELINNYKIQNYIEVSNYVKSTGRTKSSIALLDDRNITWIPQIKKIAAEKPTVFAFGAAHLPGEKGIINLLRKEGYTVKPLEN